MYEAKVTKEDDETYTARVMRNDRVVAMKALCKTAKGAYDWAKEEILTQKDNDLASL